MSQNFLVSSPDLPPLMLYTAEDPILLFRAGPAQSIFFSERYFSMGIALRPENQYRSLSFTDAVSMLDKR